MKSFLVVVDVQVGFVREKQTDHIPEKISSLMQQKEFDKIFLTQFLNAPGSNFRKILDWKGMSSAPDTDIHPLVLQAVAHRPYQIIRKETYGCPELLQELRDYPKSEILVCGIDTEACVMNIATELFDCGLRPVIWSEGCASTGGDEIHQAALRIMHRTLGQVSVDPF